MKQTYNINHYMQMQMVEMEEHRWYMGERKATAIDDYSLVGDWIETGHAVRFNEMYMSHLDECEKLASQYENKKIPNDLVHKVLED